LDAYIYQDGRNEEDVKNTQNEVAVHLLLTETKKGVEFHIFTDGACRNNGKRNAKAAWAYVLVAGDRQTEIDRSAEALGHSQPNTNQRAELLGLLNGMICAKKCIQLHKDSTVTLWSDSEYSINCASKWGLKWRANGWKKQGGEIQHLDLIKQIVNLYTELAGSLQLKWVEAHKLGRSQTEFPWCWNHRVDGLATSALN